MKNRVESMKKEIERLQNENQTLTHINEVFGQESDQLHTELDLYRKFWLPRNIQQSGHNNLAELADDESDDCATRPAKKHKGKKPANSTDEEKEAEGARVCIID